jgi:hypothetical protein
MATDEAAEGGVKRSGFEAVKEASRWLRGTLAEELANGREQQPDQDRDDDEQLDQGERGTGPARGGHETLRNGTRRRGGPGFRVGE